MSDVRKTAVLIHGCHLQADLNGKGWQEIVFGYFNPVSPTLEGRCTMGLKLAMDFGASKIILGTGASFENGIAEAEETRNCASREAFSIAQHIGYEEQIAVLQSLIDSSHLDTVSQNTPQECAAALDYCMDNGYERLVIVSSAWHIPRCHSEMLRAVRVLCTQQDVLGVIPEIIAIGSLDDPDGVTFVEQAHRGDRKKDTLPGLVRRMIRIRNDKNAPSLEKFQLAFADLLKGFGL